MNYNDLKRILLFKKPSRVIKFREKKIFEMIPELALTKGFEQNNPWHIYDAYEHILHVVDGVPRDETLRLAALFHDIGKPFVYTEDENEVGHFYEHWVVSCKIFLEFAYKYKLDTTLRNNVYNLINFHDFNFYTNESIVRKVIEELGVENVHSLYLLKKADLLAQSSEYHYLLKDLELQEESIKRLIR